MKLEIEKFLERIDEWKFKVHEELKGLSPTQRKAYWKRVRDDARKMGLNVVEPEKPRNGQPNGFDALASVLSDGNRCIRGEEYAMPAPTFYLETSVWGSLAPRQPRDRKQVVHRLLRLLDGVRGQCVITDVVVTEIEEAAPNKAEQILVCVDRAQPTIYSVGEAIETLAVAYIAAGVLPEGREADGLHVAAATCLQLDFLVSWNHRHMTRPKKRLEYEAVNQLHGYLKTPMIRHAMKLEIERFLDKIDKWKFALHEKLKGMTPAQRKAFWHDAHERARARGLNVVDAEEPAKRPAKRVRRTG